MSLEAYFSLGLVVCVLLALATNRFPTDAILVGAMALLIISGILSPAAALAGFGNSGVITIAVLFVVAAGLKETGAVHWIVQRVLGLPDSERVAQLRMMVPTAVLSAFMNNTTVVAMLIPAVQEWCRRLQMSPSRLLLPLSYVAILGGTMTLIGTSTNLVVNGLLQQSGQGLGIFDITPLGVMVALAGGVVLFLMGGRMPDRQGARGQLAKMREYGVECVVEARGPVVGKPIAEAGLRRLAHGYLAELERDGELFSAVSPDTVLKAGDRLFFVGSPECAQELRARNGLKPANSDVDSLPMAHIHRSLTEVVLSPEFPGIGQTVKAVQFRTRYHAAILSISRHGQRMQGKLGDVKLQPGDTLLVEGGRSFANVHRNNRDFLLVSALTDSNPPDHRKAPLAMGLLLLLVASSALGWLSILQAGFLVAGLMILTRCLTATQARRSVDFSVLIVIASSFSLGKALEVTGAAQGIAQALLTLGLDSPWVMLLAIYLLTTLFTELITNNAAAVLMFPIAQAVATSLGVSLMPFAIAVMFAASASFLTPLGYQTNLMVQGPGGYRFTDYLQWGLPLSLTVAAVTLIGIPFVWPF
ncbi:SLC13 family permease [Salinicola avicenniae]|uniref:SLC13 family permease n=1 Tax=Salinicola avicenniae TaxID=2916836 RepID=UPI002073C649|nr:MULTISPECIES: SLC13 family permease [unclassified Salinicola]